MQNNAPSSAPDANLKKSTGETVSDLVHRHMRDKNHTTTEEELRNAKLELHDGVNERLLKVDPEIEKQSTDEDKLPGEKDIVFTPWNVMG